MQSLSLFPNAFKDVFEGRFIVETTVDSYTAIDQKNLNRISGNLVTPIEDQLNNYIKWLNE
jgi:hypothetical protein